MKQYHSIIIYALVTALILTFIGSLQHKTDQNLMQFEEWLGAYGKKYGSPSEYAYRMRVFRYNQIKVTEHNSRAERNEETYFMELNQFADLTNMEFKQMYGHLIKSPTLPQLKANITTECKGSVADTPNPPASQNWTEKAVEPTVINEGKCGANWAISTVAAVEGLHALKIQSMVKFSDQQLIDCSGDYGNEGCGGGFMEQAYWYIIDKGLSTNKSYPLIDKAQPCKYSPAMKATNILKCARIPSENYHKLVSAVVSQPVSVAVESDKFMLYSRGVYTGPCGTDIDRGMLLVGYGKEGTNDYWILKNSLGPNWGEKGFIRLKKGSEDGPGMCGIQLAASIPLNIS